MNADLKSARSIFLSAVDEAPGEERTRYVESACAGDETLRGEVLRLLHAYGDLNSFMDHPAAGPPTVALRSAEQVGATIGRYKLLEQIGEGGMGLVYVAEQSEPVRRRVALKIIKPGMDTRQVIARFEAERQALALMDHPHIAKVHDAGASEAGHPYFVMELVRGLPITEYCDQAKIDIRRRLELFITVCHAVQHAHLKGVIHRDIKPSNVLVTLHDGQPVVKVIDFGIAKAINQQLTERTIYTAFSELIGTPLYMSPEQAELSGLDIDTRSDVYSLGVLLYELLTGDTPFDRAALDKSGLDEVRRMIREDEPALPSHRISTLKADAATTISERRGIDHRHLTRQLSGELDWIVMKALEKDRNRRYESASAFALDVERHLNDEPVAAGPPSALYRFRKFARRKRGLLIAATLGVAALLLSTAGLAISSLLIAQERDAAVAARNEASGNFQLARSAVDKLITRVAEEQLLNVPKMEQLRNSLLTDALEFYQQLLTRDNNNPMMRYEVALAQRRVGDILFDLGRDEEALDSLNDAIGRLRALIADNPGDPDSQLALAETLIISFGVLGNLAWDVQESAQSRQVNDAAKQRISEAVSLMEALVRAYPTNAEYAVGLARAQVAYHSETLLSDGRSVRNEAVAPLRNVREIIEPLANRPTATQSQRATYADVLVNLGMALAPAEAGRRALDEATQVYRDLIQADHTSVAHRNGLASALWNCSQQYLSRDQDDELAIREEFLQVVEGITTDFPSVPGNRNNLAWGHIALANSYIVPRPDGAKFIANPEAALEHYGQAKNIIEELIREDPDDKSFSSMLQRAYLYSTLVCQKHKSTAEWLRAEEELRAFVLKLTDAWWDDDERMLKAAVEEFRVCERLFDLGMNEEASKWARYSIDHVLKYLAEWPKAVKDNETQYLWWLSMFPADLRACGFHEEAANLDERIRPILDDPKYIGRYHASRGEYAEAAQQFQAALDNSPADYDMAGKAAAACLIREDRAGYEAICRRMLDQYQDTQDPLAALNVSLMCSISSSPVGNANDVVRLAELALQHDLTAVKDPIDARKSASSFGARGRAAYRAGDWEVALKWCAKSREFDDQHEWQAVNLIVEAMALHQLKKAGEAKTALEKATMLAHRAFPNAAVNGAGRGSRWASWIANELLRREAEALLQNDANDRSSESANGG